jgi:hypothetical protein
MTTNTGWKPWWSLLVLLPLSASQGAGPFTVSAPQLHAGMCDASAAVALTETLFAVGSDEDNVLRVYRNDRPGPALEKINLTSALKVDPKFPETDLEGAARVGDRIYWITSHGRNQDGEDRPSRRRFFATDLKVEGEQVRLQFVGAPCTRLLSDLAKDRRYEAFRLAQAAARAPKAPEGLNIEGLCAAGDASLLIGFRNPVPNGQALVVPLLNPGEVIEGRPAQFGEPILLDLGGYGIRDFGMLEGRGVIIAGAYDGKGKQRLYLWSGAGQTPRLIEGLRFKELNPEAVVLYPGRGLQHIQILSDDGTRKVERKPCKEVTAAAKQTFRSVWLDAR